MSNLTYVGGGRFVAGIPADTITEASLEALATKRGLKPADLRKQLVESGLYVERKSDKEKSE